MSNQVCLMELPQDILKKFVRNFKMGMVNKECYNLRQNIHIGYNERAWPTYLVMQQLKRYILQQLFYQYTGYILDISSPYVIYDEDIPLTVFTIHDLYSMWYDLDIPEINLLESLIMF